MGDAAQAGFDTPDDNRYFRVGFTATLAINNHCPVRALIAFVIRRVGVVVAQPPVSRVAIDHRIHIAGGDPEKQIRRPQRLKWFRRSPVRLGNDADPETLRFQQPANDRHAEAGMVHVGVTGDQDNVAGIPAELIHFGVRHGQEGRNTKTGGPVLAIREQRGSSVHELPEGAGPRTRERSRELYEGNQLEQCVTHIVLH